MEITHEGNVLTVIPAKGEFEAAERAKDDEVDAVVERTGASSLMELRRIAGDIEPSVVSRISERVVELNSSGEVIDAIRIDGRNMMFCGSRGLGTLISLRGIGATVQIHGLPEHSLEQVKSKRFQTVEGLEFEQFTNIAE